MDSPTVVFFNVRDVVVDMDWRRCHGIMYIPSVYLPFKPGRQATSGHSVKEFENVVGRQLDK